MLAAVPINRNARERKTVEGGGQMGEHPTHMRWVKQTCMRTAFSKALLQAKLNDFFESRGGLKQERLG